MQAIELYGQQISMSYLEGKGLSYAFKLYVDGDLRDSTELIKIDFRDWRPVARAGVLDDKGIKRELQLQIKGSGIFKQNLNWRFVHDGKVVGE